MLLDARIVVLPVHDLQKARTWYTEVLQFAPYRASHREVSFNGGGYDLRLVISRRRVKSAGTPVVYWRVDNLIAALRRFRRAGATLHCPLEESAPVGLTAAVHDPFGNVIGLVQESADLGVVETADFATSPTSIRRRTPRPLIRLA